ncbi:MAG: hypothetical protein PHP03_00415 [Candidatus Pacebacteria bacterium]|nr:hypothetical protein [Candidatus Paceibacterota bacterium]
MKLRNILYVIFAVFVPYLSANSQESISRRYSVGFSNPCYLSLKYDITDVFSAEARIGSQEGINVIGGRAYDILKKFNKTDLFAGVDAYYTFFNSNGVNGWGYAFSLLIGVEFHINDKLSVALDLGPGFTKVFDSSDMSLSDEGWGIVDDITFRVYF